MYIWKFVYFTLTFVRQWTVSTAKNILWKAIPKTMTALRQKSVVKTVLKMNKAASQLKTVLKRNSIPGLHWSTTQRPRSGITTKTSCKRFSWRDTTKAKRKTSFWKNSTCIPKGIGRCLHEQSGMDESIEKRSHPQKDHGDQRRLYEQRYVWSGWSYSSDRKEEKVFVETAIRRSNTFSRRVNRKMAITMKN